MVVLNSDLTIRLSNRSFQNLCKEDPTEISGKKFSNFIFAKHVEPLIKRFNTLLQGKNSSFEVDLLSSIVPVMKMTATKWWRISFTLVQEKATKYYLGFIQDVTQQKKNERILLAEKEISHNAMKVAEKAAKMKSDFLSTMSHEIRTPIHTIIGMGELLAETDLDEEQHEYASQISFAADVLLELINNILDFSKIEAGKLQLETIEFDLHSTFESAVELVALEAHKKNLEVGVLVHSGVPKVVRGDPVRIRQIVVNLFNNAVKFTQTGQIILECLVLNRTTEQVRLQVKVRDTGIGIPENKLSSLFKEFTQVDSSTTRKFGGTGLGLSIAKSLSELMKGNIRVESKVGVGSTFIVELEFTSPTDQFAEPFPQKIEKTILVAEDNPELRRILTLYLSEWGCKVLEADSGEKALATLRESSSPGGCPIDAALIDLTLPRMDGWQLASEINSDTTINPLGLILMSPRGTGSMEAKMKLLHWYDAYIGKPIEKSELYTALLDLFQNEDVVEVLEEVSELTNESKKPVSENPTTAWVGKKILVAEDHEVNRVLFETILASLGAEVTAVENGALAVVEAEKASFDLIFLDIHMPELNGYEAAGKIRSFDPDTPMIAATANAIKGENEKCLAAGMNDFLSKPFRKADVVEVLKKWLNPEGKVSPQTSPTPASKTKNSPPQARPPASPDPQEIVDPREHPDYKDFVVFDGPEVLDTFMDQKETVIRVLKGFLDRARTQVVEIRRLYLHNQLEELRQEAHALKGASLSISAEMLGTIAMKIEHAAVEKNLPEARAAIVLLPKTFRIAEAEIKKFLVAQTE